MAEGIGKRSKPENRNNNSRYNNSRNSENKAFRNKTDSNITNSNTTSRNTNIKSKNDNRKTTNLASRSSEIVKKKGSGKECPHIRTCGSCQRIGLGYPEDLKRKQELESSLIGKYCRVEKIIGMEEPYHYRNKVHAVFDHDRKGNPISGIYEEGTHRVIPIDSCLLHNKKADEIIVSIRNMLKSFKIKTYDEDTGYGLLRHVLIRTGFHSGEIMVLLVLADPIFPSKNNFVKALLKLHPEITTIVMNINDKATSMILGEREQVIFGKGYIEDSLCERVFRISSKSFYQINPVQTEILYRKAIKLAALTGTETVIDAYCGIGTIGLIAADKASKVIGVELNKDAVRDAVTNAKRNGIKNIQFINQDAGEFMLGMAARKEEADVVFLDPPRAGSDETFLKSLCSLKPGRVVYISCNPVTLERDMNYLIKKGYRAETAIPVDMFPWTEHVETVCLLSRKSPV